MKIEKSDIEKKISDVIEHAFCAGREMVSTTEKNMMWDHKYKNVEDYKQKCGLNELEVFLSKIKLDKRLLKEVKKAELNTKKDYLNLIYSLYKISIKSVGGEFEMNDKGMSFFALRHKKKETK